MTKQQINDLQCIFAKQIKTEYVPERQIWKNVKLWPELEANFR